MAEQRNVVLGTHEGRNGLSIRDTKSNQLLPLSPLAFRRITAVENSTPLELPRNKPGGGINAAVSSELPNISVSSSNVVLVFTFEAAVPADSRVIMNFSPIVFELLAPLPTAEATFEVQLSPFSSQSTYVHTLSGVTPSVVRVGALRVIARVDTVDPRPTPLPLQITMVSIPV